MKTPKPGQFCTINKTLYRAKRRTDGCFGCALDNIFLCPNVVDCRSKKTLQCAANGIILVKV